MRERGAQIKPEVFESQILVSTKFALAEPTGVLLDMRAACRMFRVSSHTIYRLAREGHIHAVRPQGRLLYPEWELRRVFDGGLINNAKRLLTAA
jgi:excisionase family DNA binding protein